MSETNHPSKAAPLTDSAGMLLFPPRNDEPLTATTKPTTCPLFTEEGLAEFKEKLATSQGETRKSRDERTQHLLRLLDEKGNQRQYGFPIRVEDHLEKLAAELPNFRSVVDVIARSVALSKWRNEPLELTPILIEGGPGIGKSHFANRLAEALGVPSARHDMANMQNVATLTGSDKHWANSEIGDVLNTLVTHDHMSPVFMLDEIDKAGRGAGLGDPLGSLYGLLEPENARTFCDSSFPLPINAKHIIWIATANDVSIRIPEPLISRFHHFRIEELTQSQRRNIAKSQISEPIAEFELRNGAPLEVEDEVVEAMSLLSPRKQKQCVTQMLGEVVRTNSHRLSMDHWPHSLCSLCEEEGGAAYARNRIGFLASIDQAWQNQPIPE